MDSRLHAASGIVKAETEANVDVFQTLNWLGHPEVPPPTNSQTPSVWQYLQVLKQ